MKIRDNNIIHMCDSTKETEYFKKFIEYNLRINQIKNTRINLIENSRINKIKNSRINLIENSRINNNFYFRIYKR